MVRYTQSKFKRETLELFHMNRNKKRIVVKIGTSILAQTADGIQPTTLKALVEQICSARKEGAEFILVTSGAIGAGIKKLNWEKRPQEIRKKQAAAAVGQVSLMEIYQDLFKEYQTVVAQVLLTRGDFENRQTYLNARQTLLTLLELNVVPVVNENDTVATEEIQFGDNDNLSALVAAKIDADLLIILSDVEGLLAKKGKSAELVPVVTEIGPEVEKLVWEGVKSALGTGGMSSKIQAAKVAGASGVTTVIASAFRANVIADILEGKSVGTKFVAMKALSAKQRWILFGAIPKGALVVDQGAALALKNLNKSLLPAGVVGTNGSFRKGDVVSVASQDGQEIGRGIVSYSSDEVEKIKGQKTSEIKKILKASNSTEIIHRDVLVLWK